MAIDGALLWGIIEKVAIAIAGYATAYLLEKRTKLVVYFGHVAAFRVTPPQQHPMAVHTHSLVLRNGGRSPATGVRIPHRVSLAPGENVHFAVEPNIPYSTTPLPGGGTEIKIDVLVPKQQVTVSYLYFPPLLFSQIHDQITCDQMIARVIMSSRHISFRVGLRLPLASCWWWAASRRSTCSLYSSKTPTQSSRPLPAAGGNKRVRLAMSLRMLEFCSPSQG